MMTISQLGDALAMALHATKGPEGHDLDSAALVFYSAIRERRLSQLALASTAAKTQNDNRGESIAESVAIRRGLTIDSLRGRTKYHAVVAAREEAIWEMRQLQPPVSYARCARAVGMWNHTSAMDAEARYEAKIASAKAA